MMKRSLVFIPVAAIVMGAAITIHAQGTNVGGHVVLSVYDRPSGTHNDVQSSNYIGFSFRRVFLFFSKELTDKISIDIQPEWSASTGATPKLGSEIANKNHSDDIEPEFHGLVKAVVTAMLPKDFELSFGIVKPLFSWDYGHELFWEEEFNGGKWSCNDNLGSIHDAGFELYRNFDIGKMSLPAYLYVLNGFSQGSDNNKTPAILATVEPEFGPIRLKASYFTGRWNDAWDDEGKWDGTTSNNVTKYLVGASFQTGPFSVRGEFAGSTWAKKLNDDQDAKAMGYYGKVFYRFASWGRLMFHYDYVDYNFSGSALGDEKYVTISPGLIIYASDSALLMATYDIADWKRDRAGGLDTVKFKRLTIGWRITF